MKLYKIRILDEENFEGCRKEIIQKGTYIGLCGCSNGFGETFYCNDCKLKYLKNKKQEIN